MYCGECGAKNSNSSKFCESCGAPLENEHENKSTTKNVKNTNTQISKNKIILIVLAAVIVIGGFIGFRNLKKQSLPETIAKEYFEAYKSSDAKKMYQYFDIDQNLSKNEFTTKDMFIKTIITKDQKKEASKIQSYQITKVEKNDDGLTTKVTINYTTTSSLTSKSKVIYLKKSSKKKFLLFDNWKVSLGDNYVKENYSISLPKGSKAKLEGKDLSSYKDKSKSTSTTDVYKIPKIFRGEYKLTSSLSYGFDITDTINTSLGSTYKANISTSSVPSKIRKDMTAKVTDLINTFYQGAIAKTEWDQIKDKFKGLDTTGESNFKATYESLISKANSDTKQLTAYELFDINLADISTSSSSNGDLVVTFKIKYNYTLNYKPLFSSEIKTKTSASSASLKFNFRYSDKEFIISRINTFVYTFS